jgi:hypothetical protein
MKPVVNAPLYISRWMWNSKEETPTCTGDFARFTKPAEKVQERRIVHICLRVFVHCVAENGWVLLVLLVRALGVTCVGETAIQSVLLLRVFH